MPAKTVTANQQSTSAHLTGRTLRAARLSWWASGAAAIALLAAGCSGVSSTPAYGGAPQASSNPPASSAPPAASLVDVHASSHGRILVDGQGRTLYLFEADKADKSTCNGGCAAAWPPYITEGSPRAGTGVTGRLLGTSARGDGRNQVTYHRHPLYYYVGDDQPGAVMGQGLNQFGAKWYVVAPNGNKIDDD